MRHLHVFIVLIFAGNTIYSQGLGAVGDTGVLQGPVSSFENKNKNIIPKEEKNILNEEKDIILNEEKNISNDEHISSLMGRISMEEASEVEKKMEDEVVKYVLFFTVCFISGGIIQWLVSLLKYKPPVTVSLYISGILIGLLRPYYPAFMADFGGSVLAIEHLNAHVILFVFVPSILYETAVHLNFTVFKTVLPSALLLAAPGVGIFCFVMFCCHVLYIFDTVFIHIYMCMYVHLY